MPPWECASHTPITRVVCEHCRRLTPALSLSSAGSTSEAAPPAPPPPEAQPTETKAPEEEMDVVDDDITAGMRLTRRTLTKKDERTKKYRLIYRLTLIITYFHIWKVGVFLFNTLHMKGALHSGIHSINTHYFLSPSRLPLSDQSISQLCPTIYHSSHLIFLLLTDMLFFPPVTRQC